MGMALLTVAAWADLGDVRFSGGSYDGWDQCVMTSAVGLGDALVSLSSGSDQLFDWTQEGPALATLTITAENPAGTITNGVTMHICVPTAWQCRFDTGAAVTCGEGAASKVDAPTYSGDGRTLLIPVTSDFEATDTLTLSGLKLVDLQLVPDGSSRLELDFTGDGGRDVYDSYTMQVRVQWPGGAYDGWDGHTTAGYATLSSIARGSTFFFR